jgi:hypothetical protein
VVEDHQFFRIRTVIAIEAALQIVTLVGLEVIGLGMEAGEILRLEIKDAVAIVLADKQLAQYEIHYLLFKQHGKFLLFFSV